MKNKLKSLITLLLFTFFCLLLSNSYSQLVQDFRVNDDSTNYSQGDAKMGVDRQGNFVVVWEDHRRMGRSNIYCQRFDSLANRLGNNFIINTNLDTASTPYISIRNDGSFGVCWYETNSYVYNRAVTKFRIFNKFGIPISNEIIINDTITSYNMSIDVGTDSIGNFIIAYSFKLDIGSDKYDIYFQQIDKFGNKIGYKTKVNDDTGIYFQNYPKIAVRRDGSFIITWQDQRPPVPMNGCDDIYMQMYDSQGNKIGVNTRVNDVFNIYDLEARPYISYDTSGAFCIGFTKTDFSSYYSYAVIQLYDKNGTKIGNNINNGIAETATRVLCKRNNGDMVIGFGYDNGYLWRAYFQRRKASGELIPGVFQVSNQATNINNGYGDGILFNNNIISIFGDSRNGKTDIFCNIRSYLNPDSILTDISKIKNETRYEFKLFQNYPNPFNAMTKIKFDIPAKTVGQTFLSVYDILGKEIATLVNESALGGQPGTYSVDFDGTNFPSGIYFYKLSAGKYSETRKMLMIK